ncbi:MAG: efflux RND transporter periplasmic adaptor subunit [Gammaproteobacteria bacterium]|jgi:HlyD family secretion protein
MSEQNPNRDTDVSRVLGLEQHARHHWHIWRWLAGIGLLLVVLLLVMVFSGGKDNGIRYETSLAKRSDLTVTVTATGTIEPVNQVDVGTEVSGTVESVEVDYNDHVKVGQLLAKLNTDQLSAKLRQSEAELTVAKAKVLEAQATLLETRNRLNRLKTLVKREMASQDDVDTAQAAYSRAQAGLEVTRAQVKQAQAQVDSDRTTLSKAVIVSPINGIVLERSVEPGQTVAASLQTPVLFTLAENLKQMELDVAVDEADVGQVKEGQHATFTVDAYPDRIYSALVTQVRYAPQTVDGVVTYDTILSVNNADLSLRPGMTATVDITVESLKNALLIPNAALRFTPPVTKTASGGSRSIFSRLFPRPASHTAKPEQPLGEGKKRVWTLKNGKPVAIPVTVGASDGKMTAVVKGDISPDMPLLVDYTNVKQ